MLFKITLSLILSLCLCKLMFAQTIYVDEALPGWTEGYMDLHHINTGRGNCMYAILPDGTTMMIDAGELSPLDKRTFTPRNAGIKPDSSAKPFEWIVRYIRQVASESKPVINYALITHFHDDHFGAWYPEAPISANGNYKLTGITGVGEMLRINKLFDRGYPDYEYPYDLRRLAASKGGGEIEFESTMQNYFAFTLHQKKIGMKMEKFRAGSSSGITLERQPDKYPDFYIRNIKANQYIWTGNDSSVYDQFKNNKNPDENSMSLALTINYGPFTYYTGGDNAGNVFPGDDSSRDVETSISSAIGEVEVATMDHHGNRDAVNATMIRNFKSQVWIGQSWSADHPGHEVLIRLTSPYINPVKSDLFATNMLEANRHVIGPLIDNAYKSQQGHIVVRVHPGGKEYYIIILDDQVADLKVKSFFGPYYSKTNTNK